MFKSAKTSELEQSRSSKIQIEVKEIAQPTTRKPSRSNPNADADGDDLRSE
jgi:hypothetical protein